MVCRLPGFADRPAPFDFSHTGQVINRGTGVKVVSNYSYTQLITGYNLIATDKTYATHTVVDG